MDLSIFYTFIIYLIYTVLTVVLLYRTYRQNIYVSRTLITILNIIICVDYCLYAYGISTFLSTASNGLQLFLKNTLGLVFIYRNSLFDYGFILFMLFVFCLIIKALELRLTPARSTSAMHIHSFSIRQSKKSSGRLLPVINTVCVAAASIVTVLNLVMNLK